MYVQTEITDHFKPFGQKSAHGNIKNRRIRDGFLNIN